MPDIANTKNEDWPSVEIAHAIDNRKPFALPQATLTWPA